MTDTTADVRTDRLYNLLPAIYRIRDAEQKYPLRALLRVIAEQVNVVEADIAQLYDNWFIETSEDWAVPYIADLIGYRPLLDAGAATDATTRESRELNRVLVPRREAANTIRYRRRKGTLALLELLANDIAGWPARAVEYFKLLGWHQNVNHLHLERARTANLRHVERLDLVDSPFDSIAHTVDVRHIDSHHTIGRYNIPSVGLFVWRLKLYSVTRTPAFVEDANEHCCTFSVLGQDAPLFLKPEPEAEPTRIAGEVNVPAPLRRLAFAKHPERYYGDKRSLAIWASGWAEFDPDRPIPASAIVPADLSKWQYVPPRDHIAVDPVLGRFAFPPDQLPANGAQVMYHYGFSADMGGGEYARDVLDPSPRDVDVPDPNDPTKSIRQKVAPMFYRVGADQVFHSIGAALEQWKQDNPWDAVIELTDSAVYTEPISVMLQADRTLQLRAANRTRPVIRLLDWQVEKQDALSITMGAGSRFTMDGLLVTGRPLHIAGPERQAPTDPRSPVCGARVVIRHCTLVPGWGIDCDCKPDRQAPSLEAVNIRATLRIEHSILGSIEINEDEVGLDPIPARISDSILDATDPEKEAVGTPGYAVAHAVLTMLRCTVFGIVDAHAIELAENCIFNDCVNVARRQRGCMRFCYVPPGCRTPRRYRCQPDLGEQAVNEATESGTARDAAIAGERLRVRPQFTSIRYGKPGYGQLSVTCAEEITRGSDDESEMGVFHDLFQPQRAMNLRARLEEYTPAGTDVGLLIAT